MPKQVPLHVTVDYNYAKQGGWKAVESIFTSSLGYDEKIAAVEMQFGIHQVTARRWHSHFNKMRKDK